EDLRAILFEQLTGLIDEQTTEPAAHALALCVSADYAAAVRLGRSVQQRVVVDDTFATRDLVADLNRTARYRVVTVSDRKTRLLLGDRARLVEERTDLWPMLRSGESSSSWARDIARQLREENTHNPLPTVIAGVDRTVRTTILPELFDTIGFIPGNHDRTSWADLHNAAWPLITDWLRSDGTRAIETLSQARSTCRFAGGIDEIWPLANEGRIETLVVEDNYALSARITDGQIERAADREAPDVVDDIIDDTIEAVLRHNGKAVIVPDGELHAHDRIAAVLRY
ncbi:MAG: hypothetical protein ABI658_21960, partial [Acidimicrobiales bacterium]